MAKAARAFQMPEEDRVVAPPPAALPVEADTSGAPSMTITATMNTTIRPPYREGRRNLSVWMDAKGFNSFKAMVAMEGSTVNDYVVEMINREFARKGLPQIAKK